jgi:hypothetical protein
VTDEADWEVSDMGTLLLRPDEACFGQDPEMVGEHSIGDTELPLELSECDPRVRGHVFDDSASQEVVQDRFPFETGD